MNENRPGLNGDSIRRFSVSPDGFEAENERATIIRFTKYGDSESVTVFIPDKVAYESRSASITETVELAIAAHKHAGDNQFSQDLRAHVIRRMNREEEEIRAARKRLEDETKRTP